MGQPPSGYMETTKHDYLIRVADLEPGQFLWFGRDEITLAAIREAVRRQYPGRPDLVVTYHGNTAFVHRAKEAE